MQTIHPARLRFRQLIRQPQINLAEAALCVAWENQGNNATAQSLGVLDALAAALRPRLAGLAQPSEIVLAFNSFLFGECEFKGNTWHYDDPANSFLDRVLEMRAGLPITLSIIAIEVGRRLDLPISGVGLPGHFLACYGEGADAIYIDPFNRGRRWSRDECLHQIATFYGDITPQLIAQVLAPPSNAAILVRLLRNLKNLYGEQAAFPAALAAVERILLIQPDSADDLRDRGLLHAQLGQIHGALEDFDRYARLAPNALDLPQIRAHAKALAARAMREN